MTNKITCGLEKGCLALKWKIIEKWEEGINALFSTEIFDFRTGKAIGVGIIWAWRGKIFIWKLKTKDGRAIIPCFVPQKNPNQIVKLEIGFRLTEEPDEPRLCEKEKKGE